MLDLGFFLIFALISKCSEECKKDVPVVLIDMHNCSLDSKLKMSLDSTVVKKAVETKKPAPPRKKGVKSAPKAKKSKDPNMPKRPQTAFFLFMDDFRKSFKESHPDNKKVGVVSKEGGERWKNMPDEEKKVYLDRAAELKREYEKAVEKLNSENENGEEEQEDDEKAEEKPDSENENNEEDQGEMETGDEDEKVEEQLDSANVNEQDKQEESDKGED
ncbi:High mobility group b protein [Thalictrum thalictroides]|uniref:High mobility group b protein n=1 Tax=Thalictrum thalictroides TaxID=46969 RepID=A0A7J6V5P0_THATH|nr:High mobility group b protein [Thalictrum thalictroides]